MRTNDGYTLHYERKKNQITITLPQTQKTLTCTTLPLSNRKIDISLADEAVILSVVKTVFENGGMHERDD